MITNPIRKFLNRFGVDLHKFRPVPDRLEWFKEIGIKTVIDVGANVGQFAKEIRTILPSAKIYSFEPIGECFLELNKNMTNDKNWSAFNFALGDMEQVVGIHKSKYSPGSSILEMEDNAKSLFPHIEEESLEEIKIKVLDDLDISVESEILVKIDTEGYEKNVILGGKNFIRKAKVLIIENSFIPRFRDAALFDEIYKMLHELGFSYKGRLSEKINPKNGAVIFEDSIFLKD